VWLLAILLRSFFGIGVAPAGGSCGRGVLNDGACGYCKHERFRHAIYFHLGGLDLYPETLNRHTKG